LSLTSSLPKNVKRISSNYSVKAVDKSLVVTALSSSITVKLPPAPSVPTLGLAVQDISGECSSTKKIILTPHGAEKINGNTSFEITSPLGSAILFGGINGWTVLNSGSGVGDVDSDLLNQLLQMILDSNSYHPSISVRMITSSGSMLNSDDVLQVDSTSAPVTITLQDVTTCTSKRYTIKKVNTYNGNKVTIQGASGQLISGVNSWEMKYKSSMDLAPSYDKTYWELI